MDWMYLIAAMIGFVLRHKAPSFAAGLKSIFQHPAAPAAGGSAPAPAPAIGSEVSQLLAQLLRDAMAALQAQTPPVVVNPAPTTVVTK